MLSRSQIIDYSAKYEQEYPRWVKTEQSLLKWFREHQYLNRPTFIKLGMWKSPRPKKRYKANSDRVIRSITSLALRESDEEIKIKLLMILNGVSWSVASTILHFASPSRYPILDFRALESLGWKQPSSYDFKFWKKYFQNWRTIHRNLRLPGRIIDRALYQYSKEASNRRRS